MRLFRENLDISNRLRGELHMLAEKLASLRRRRGLSQQEVAQALGITRQTVSNWECGQGAPAIDRARDLALLYGIGLEDLVSDEISVVAPAQQQEEVDLHVLSSLVGATCKLAPARLELLAEYSKEFADGRRYRILGVEDGWLRVEYEVAAGITKSEPAVTLIDSSLVGSVLVVGDAR